MTTVKIYALTVTQTDYILPPGYKVARSADGEVAIFKGTMCLLCL